MTRCLTILIFALLLLPFHSGARTITVSTLAAFNSSMQELQPGDTVLWANGTYHNMQLQFKPVLPGNAGQPIVFAAERPGGVVFTGNSRLWISGRYLVVHGFTWTGTNTLGTNDVIRFTGTSTNHNTEFATLSHCAIIDYNPADTLLSNRWVLLYGRFNTIEHCSFIRKRNLGATVVVAYAEPAGWQPGDSTAPSTFHLLRRNLFRDRWINGTNGGESIRVGDSQTSFTKGYNIIEENYFTGCLVEPEVISNKSCNNTYRYNSFVENEGGLVFRHGNNNLAEGNYFYAPNTPRAPGIRIIGERQVVVNNYFEQMRGANVGNLRSPIVLMCGVENPALNAYFQVIDPVIAYNSFVNCNGPVMRVGSVKDNPATRPLGVTIANNIVYNTTGSSTTGRLAIYEESLPLSRLYEGNQYFGGSTVSLAGWQPATADVLSLQGNSYRPEAGSSLVNAGVGDYTYCHGFTISKDRDGCTRTGTWDVGADEYNCNGPFFFNLQADSTGVCWMRPGGCDAAPVTTSVRTPLKEAMDLKIFPVPFADAFWLRFVATENGLHTIRLLDAGGRLAWTTTARLQKGQAYENRIVVKGPAGAYHVLVYAPGGTIGRPTMKVNREQ